MAVNGSATCAVVLNGTSANVSLGPRVWMAVFSACLTTSSKFRPVFSPPRGSNDARPFKRT